MDIFEKCIRRQPADEVREMGIYPYFHALESRQDVEVIMEGKRRIMLGSNNYLGLTINPNVIEAGIKAVEKYGTGCSGSRFLNGTLSMSNFSSRATAIDCAAKASFASMRSISSMVRLAFLRAFFDAGTGPTPMFLFIKLKVH